jgi:ribosomal protein S18 acetylase RimI-like enzyme
MLEILQAQSKEDLELVRVLLEEYGKWGVNVGLAYPEEYQAFLEQIANLPGVFAPPDGCVLLAKYQGRTSGCVALRKLTEDTCEMKRLYVTPEMRGRSIGRALAIAVIEQARKIGYTRMRLDTVASMRAAKALYKSLGFKEIEPYRYNPLEGATFMELELA